jgi:hypothetical protein
MEKNPGISAAISLISMKEWELIWRPLDELYFSE